MSLIICILYVSRTTQGVVFPTTQGYVLYTTQGYVFRTTHGQPLNYVSRTTQGNSQFDGEVTRINLMEVGFSPS